MRCLHISFFFYLVPVELECCQFRSWLRLGNSWCFDKKKNQFYDFYLSELFKFYSCESTFSNSLRDPGCKFSDWNGSFFSFMDHSCKRSTFLIRTFWSSKVCKQIHNGIQMASRFPILLIFGMDDPY